MKREPMVFAVAGMVFGFVLGYMASGLADRPSSDTRPRPTDAGPRPAAGAGAPTSGAAGAGAPASDRPTGPADPDEVRTLENLAARDKQNLQARIELGNLLMDHAQYEEAARWYREALALKPADNDVRVDLGACLLNMGRAGDAIAEFDHALKNDPAHKKAMFNKGLALMQTGRTQEALALWEGLLKRYPDDPQLQGLRQQVERLRSGRAASGGPS